jgi:Tol biopolymer transport system component
MLRAVSAHLRGRLTPLAVLLGSGLAAFAPPAHAAFPGRPGLIAYAVTDYARSGLSWIATVHVDGSHRRLIHSSRIGDDSGFGAETPVWSADGRWIAFTDVSPHLAISGSFSEGLYVIRAGGGGLRRLTSTMIDVREPAWSPNGKRIVFVTHGQLYAIGANGTGLIRLTTQGGDQPAWSTRGAIAFVRRVGGRNEIYSMHPDGSHLRRLTSAGGSSPDWSPSGGKLTFERGGRIDMISADGSNVKRITSGHGTDARPAFSPTGRQIVFTRGANLWVVDADGRHAHRLLTEPPAPAGSNTLGAGDPSWQPMR